MTVKGLSNSKVLHRDLPGGPVAETLCFQCRGLGSTNSGQGTRSHMPQLKIPSAKIKTQHNQIINIF